MMMMMQYWPHITGTAVSWLCEQFMHEWLRTK